MENYKNISGLLLPGVDIVNNLLIEPSNKTKIYFDYCTVI